MVDLKYVKRIYDEVHGYIGLTEVELRIVDSPAFQRLRFVKQLAMAWYVYPGATHTRFSHSIGVMHIAHTLASKLYSQGFITSKDDIQMIRLAALLHDVGHPPFSHAVEPLYEGFTGLTHEELAETIISETPSIKENLLYYGFQPREIAAIIKGTHKEKLFNQILSGEIDADRMDYLLRDSLHTGVAYGVIDISRLVETVTVDSDGRLAFFDKALDAVENFYLARMHMYKAVYYHKTLVGYEILLRRILEEMFAVGSYTELFFRDAADLSKKCADESIALWHDDWLFSRLLNYLNHRHSMLSTLIKALLFRRGLKIHLDYSQLSNERLDANRDPEVVKLFQEREKLMRNNTLGIVDAVVFVDDIKIVDQERENLPRVVFETSRSIPVIEHPNTILKFIPRRYHIKRLYVLRWNQVGM